MSGKIPLGPQSLKRQLQAANAKRRAHNQGKTRVVAAAHGHHRNDPQPDLVTVWKPVSSLRASPNRTRETTAHMLEGTVRSIQKFGMVLPILIDADDVIVAGHALWEAARQLDFDRIECRVIDHLDPIECEALALALNRIGEIGKYDLDKLRDRMIAIESHGIELVSTGFTLPEISQIKLTPLCDDIDDLEHDGLEDGVHSLSISREGDLFHLGHHQLLCGDAVAEASYQRLLNGTLVQMVFSDPPYHCKIAGFVSGLGKHKHEDFLMFAGQESDAEFRKFMEDYLRLCKDVMPSGAVIFACMDWRQIDTLLDAGRAAELNRINIAVWNKGSGGMGGYLRSAHEFVAIFCNGKSLAINNVALGVHGRDRTNVWTYPGANRAGSSAAKALADHPTPKPVELVIDAILDVTHPGDVVLDPFAGSGTTIIACEQCDRIARGIELDPKYVDRAIRRWEQLTGASAVHTDSGLTFAQLADRRITEGAESDDDGEK